MKAYSAELSKNCFTVARNAFQDDFWSVGPFQYQRHQPENTLLYQLVKEHWPQALSVPFPLRYLFATNPQVMSRVLTIVQPVISTFLIKRSGRAVKSGAQSGAVTLIQRFVSGRGD